MNYSFEKNVYYCIVLTITYVKQCYFVMVTVCLIPSKIFKQSFSRWILTNMGISKLFHKCALSSVNSVFVGPTAKDETFFFFGNVDAQYTNLSYFLSKCGKWIEKLRFLQWSSNPQAVLWRSLLYTKKLIMIAIRGSKFSLTNMLYRKSDF